MREIVNNMLVLKVGTSTLVHRHQGVDQLDTASFERIGVQIDEAVNSGRGVVLVSSGARQRLPDVGWERVVETWDRAIGAATEDFLLRDRDFDSLPDHALFACARRGRVAIVNDDPTLSRHSPYRNNDLLAAAIAQCIGKGGMGTAEAQLGILSDVGGVLADTNDHHSVIPVIHDIGAYEYLAGCTNTPGATGGMATKFAAARIALESGVQTWVAHGRMEGVVQSASQGCAGTRFTGGLSG